jgi:hypothetical protein
MSTAYKDAGTTWASLGCHMLLIELVEHTVNYTKPKWLSGSPLCRITSGRKFCSKCYQS